MLSGSRGGQDFEREFRSFIGRNLLVGALLPASLYGVAKAALGASVLF